MNTPDAIGPLSRDEASKILGVSVDYVSALAREGGPRRIDKKAAKGLGIIVQEGAGWFVVRLGHGDYGLVRVGADFAQEIVRGGIDEFARSQGVTWFQATAFLRGETHPTQPGFKILDTLAKQAGLKARLTVSELRLELRIRKLKTTGSKAVLQARLDEAIEQDKAAEKESA